MKSVFKIGCGIALGVAIVVIAIIVVISLAVSNGSNNSKVTQVPNSGGSGGSNSGGSSGGNTFVLKVVGHHTQRADITYSDPNVNMSQDNNVKLPWTKTFQTNADTGLIGFQVMAQNKSGHGSVTCEIVKNGKVVQKQSGHGGYAIASCGPSNQ